MRTLDLCRCVVIFPMPINALLFHRTPIHATIWNIDHMLHDYCYVMSARSTYLPATATSLTFYTTGYLLIHHCSPRGVEILVEIIPYALLV